MGAEEVTPAELPLLRAILHDPANDGPRLAFADWCEDNGDYKTAGYIRLAIKYANGQPWTDDELMEFGVGTYRREPQGIEEWRWRRGFVDEITLTMGQLMGDGDCQTCGGSGYERFRHFDGTEEGEVFQESCVYCSGAELATGLAKWIFKNWPVTRVNISNRAPQSYGKNWHWNSDWAALSTNESILPNVILDLMPAQEWERAFYSFPTRDAALSALSDACVRHGRSINNHPILLER